MVDAICNIFTRIGYECKKEFNLKEITRRPIRVDLFCKNEAESLIVEAKAGDFGLRDIMRLVYLRTIPGLSETKLYLAIRNDRELSDEQRTVLAQNDIRTIRVGGRHDIVFERPFPGPDRLELDRYFAEEVFPERYVPERFAPEELTYAKKMSLMEVSAYATQRKIPPFFLEKMGFSKLTYARDLNDFVEDYGNVRNADEEVDIILKYVEKLWSGKYGKTESVKAFANFNDFEPVLKRIRGYRDHFTHPFQVFLLGSRIIDKHYKLIERIIKKKMPKIEKDTLDFSWLLAATFHDFCYPIQMFNDFTGSFFSEFLQTKEVDVSIDLKKILLDEESLHFIDQLVCLYDFYGSSKSVKQWLFNSECVINKELRRSFLRALVNNQDHGILSSLTLLKKIIQEDFVRKDKESYLKGRFSTDVYPAALAIALHNLAVCKNGLKMPKIRFEDSPLIVLLIYCDLVQEWGRPSKHRVDVDFVDFKMQDKDIQTAISVKKSEDFENKRKEFKRAFKKLSSSQLHFSLKMVCEEDGEESIVRIPDKQAGKKR